MKPTKSIFILLSLFLIFSCDDNSVEPDTTPPTVSIQSPVSGETVSGTIGLLQLNITNKESRISMDLVGFI